MQWLLLAESRHWRLSELTHTPPWLILRELKEKEAEVEPSVGLSAGTIIEKRMVLGYVEIDLWHSSTWQILPDFTIEEFDER